MATQSLMEQAQELAQQNQVTPTTQEFDESKGVAGRVSSLTSQDSPLMTQARTRGMQGAAARGLTNSSLAGQAAEEAVIGAATPIASADAGLYQQQSLTNQNARNTASTANAQIGATLGGQALGLENSNTQQDKSLAESARQFNTSSGQNQQQIDAQIAQFAQSLGMTVQDLALRRDQLSQNDRQFLDTLNEQKSQFATNSAQNQQQITNQASQFGQTLQEQQRQQASQQQFQTMEAGLDRDNKVKIAEIQSANNEAINSNGNISSAWQQMSVNIANIQNNPNIDEATKRTLIQNQMDSFAGFASFWKKAGGSTIDISDLLNFQLGPAAPPSPAPPPSEPDYNNGNVGGDSGGD